MKLTGEIKQYLKAYLKASVPFSLIYIVIYLITSFTILEFNNPFQWIIDIPSYEEVTRLGIAFYYILYLVIKIAITIKIKEKAISKANEIINNR